MNSTARFITPRAGLSYVSATLDSVALPDSAGGGELAMKDANVSKGMAGVLLSLDGIPPAPANCTRHLMSNTNSPANRMSWYTARRFPPGSAKPRSDWVSAVRGIGTTVAHSLQGNIGYASGAGGDGSYSAGIGLNFVF